MRAVAPGGPGIEPRWTSSAKSGIGTSASASSRVWFTISHGILNEIYFPRVDIANTRDPGFMVADGICSAPFRAMSVGYVGASDGLTFWWPEAGTWEDTNFQVTVVPAGGV